MEADLEKYNEIKAYAKDLVGKYGRRNEIMEGIENEYLMHKTDEDIALEKSNPSIALTKSPDARNSIKGVVRLLTTTRPEVSVPAEKNNPDAEDVADKLEMAGNALLAANDRYSRRPLHYDATLSAVLYDALNIEVVSTKDLVEQSANLSPAKKERIKKLSKATPYIFKVLHPRECYPVWDDFGLQSFLRVSRVTVGSVLDAYESAKNILGTVEDLGNGYGKKTVDRMDTVTLYDYWDDTYRCVWLEGYDKPLMCEPHELKFIPIVSATMEGSGMFSEPEDQHEPFLYTAYESGITQRKTEALTAMSTMQRVYGFNPAFVVQKGDAGQEIPQMERVGLFQMFVLEPGQTITPMLNKGVIDPSTLTAYQIFADLGEQSTIFKSTLGGSQAGTYSETALLSQLGRIPLETVRAMTGRAIADALEIAFEWARTSGGVKAFNYQSGALAEIAPDMIPEFINIDVVLEVGLPQDKLQQMTVATQAVKDGITSLEYAHENYLGIKQSSQMKREMLKERIINMLIETQLQQAFAPPQPPQQPAQEGGLPPGIPPEMMQGGMGGPEIPMQEQQMMPPEEMGGLEGLA